MLTYGMDKTITRFDSLEEMDRAATRDWLRLSGSERIKAATDITLELYRMTGQVQGVPRLQRTLVRIQRPPG